MNYSGLLDPTTEMFGVRAPNYGSVDPKASARAQKIAISALKDLQTMEARWGKKLGMSAEDIAQIKLDNASELQQFKASAPTQNWTDPANLYGIKTSSSGEGGYYADLENYLNRAGDVRKKYGLSYRGGDPDGMMTGIGTNSLISREYHKDRGLTFADPTVSNVSKMLDFADQYYGKPVTSDILKQYGWGAVKGGENNPYYVSRNFKVGNNDKGSVSIGLQYDPVTGQYTPSAFDASHLEVKEKKGLGGLGGLIALALTAWNPLGFASPALAGAFGGGVGGALSGGGVEGMLKGAALGGLGGGIGEVVSGLPGGSNFVGPVNPSDFVVGSLTSQQLLGNLAKGAILGGAGAALNGGDIGKALLTGGLSGGLGAYNSQFLPSWMANPLAGAAVSSAFGGKTTPRSLAMDAANNYLANQLKTYARK